MIIDFEPNDTMMEKYQALYALIKEQQQMIPITDMIGGPELMSIFETDESFVLDAKLDEHNYQSLGTWNSIRCWKVSFPQSNPLAKTLTVYAIEDDEIDSVTVTLKNFFDFGFSNEPTECTNNA